jgi:hypothetical protein
MYAGRDKQRRSETLNALFGHGDRRQDRRRPTQSTSFSAVYDVLVSGPKDARTIP